jgi:hypothetical protein
MTKDDIIRMVLESGGLPDPMVFIAAYERFSHLVAAAEREACAKVCDVLAVHPEYASDVTKLAAKAIRARGNT